MEASIPLTNPTPIVRQPYRIPLALQSDVQKQIADMLRFDIIRPSQSPWSFSLVTVRKKDNSTRICCDLRPLNKVVSFFSFPMANIDQTIGSLSKAKYFTSLDLNQAYFHIGIKPEDQDTLSFVCDEGKFAFKRLPF